MQRVSGSSKRAKNAPASPPGGSAPANPAEPNASPFPPRPLKPRPLLLTVISIVFVLWVGFLVTLYFKTEYPRRSIAPRPDAKGNLVPEAPAPGAR